MIALCIGIVFKVDDWYLLSELVWIGVVLQKKTIVFAIIYYLNIIILEMSISCLRLQTLWHERGVIRPIYTFLFPLLSGCLHA